MEATLDNENDRRQASALQRAARVYAVEDRGRTWRLLLTTLAVYGLGFCGAVLAPWWPVQLLGSVLLGLVTVRLFIFYHDHLHGAIFRDSPLGKLVMTWVGFHTLNPPSVWKETHDYHHLHNAKMLGAAIGSYPVVTTGMWKGMNPTQRRWYAFARHPLTILFGYFTVFMAGMCLASFVRAPRRHWQGPLALLLHVGFAAALTWLFGFSAALFGLILPTAITSALGAYLFYAQHNFPGIELRDRRSWDYQAAALKSSSYFVMSPLMHWFTGNIGYHHIHHLNHKIPFYRLPEAMEAVPELQAATRTSWSLGDVRACLALKLWDPQLGRMTGWPS